MTRAKLQKSRGATIIRHKYQSLPVYGSTYKKSHYLILDTLLALFSTMHNYLEQEHIHVCMKNTDNKQDEIAEVFNDSAEYMKNHNIAMLTTLAKYYYETEKITNYHAYTEDDTEKEEDTTEVSNPEYLYMLIQYEGEDFLVHIGTGEFSPEVFTRRNIPQLMWLSHSPFPLFVITAWAKKEYQREEKQSLHKDAIIRKFLNEHAIIYSPKWGQAESRSTMKQRETPIDYGKSNGVIKYQDVMLTLQNSVLDKICNTKECKEKVIQEIANIQKFSKEEFAQWMRKKEDHYRTEEKILLWMLKDMTDRNDDNEDDWMDKKRRDAMHSILKIFNTKKLVTKLHN